MLTDKGMVHHENGSCGLTGPDEINATHAKLTLMQPFSCIRPAVS